VLLPRSSAIAMMPQPFDADGARAPACMAREKIWRAQQNALRYALRARSA